MKPRLFLPAIASGLLLWTAFFPLNLGPVSFVALAPWLTLVRAPASNRRRYFATYLGGLVFFLAAVQWMRVAHPMMYFSWIGLSLACAVSWVLALWLIRRLDSIGFVPLALSVPLVWVALEFTRAHFPTGYPFLASVGLYQMIGFGWYFLGYTMHDLLPLIQIADLGGVYTVSFLVAAVNGLAAEWLLRSGRVRTWLHWTPDVSAPTLRRLIPSSITVAALFGGAIFYGLMKLDHEPFEDGPRVALLQGSVPQDVKNEKGDLLGDTYYALYEQAANATPKPDLVVWPETCCPYAWYQPERGSKWEQADAQFLVEARVYLGGLYKEHRPITTLYGLNGMVWENDRVWKYNTAVLLGPGREFVGRYDKMHLVPFGEYVPLRETLPFLSVFTPYENDYSCKPGSEWTKFPLVTQDGRQFTFGCLICYEDSDPYLARHYASPDQPVNFLVNISNDGWFRGTEEHEQHLATCRFRAVETRRSVVRAVNMGISAVIDPDGRVIETQGDSWSRSKQVEGVILAVVPIDGRLSWYARTGDWLPGLCWTLIAVGLLWARWKRKPAA